MQYLAIRICKCGSITEIVSEDYVYRIIDHINIQANNYYETGGTISCKCKREKSSNNSPTRVK
jgi:hypothetical protein